jgi:excisionase family DNA binding protein
MEKLKELYTVAEVAGILGVSEKSVRDFINAGELRAVKVGQWRIARESIGAFMDARSNQYQSRARSEVISFLDGV